MRVSIRAEWLVVWFLLVVLTAGCGPSKLRQNNDNMLRLQIGMTKNEVREIMGNPTKTEAYLIDGKNHEFWMFQTQRQGRFERLSDKHYTPVAFVDEKLIGWGRNFYDNVVRTKQDINVKQDITVEQK
jgi:outer membrane protein assembly factor BamE (lipoprotein component of BamABCDE complex)